MIPSEHCHRFQSTDRHTKEQRREGSQEKKKKKKVKKKVRRGTLADMVPGLRGKNVRLLSSAFIEVSHMVLGQWRHSR
jgi:hypothetical protein